MCGYDVAYLTGTDEHGVNIERAAEKAGMTPQQLVDKNEKIFRELWKLLGITITGFIRTTEPRHALAVQNLVRRTMRVSPNAIYKRKYEGRYCIYDNLYVSDTPEPADCQICGRPGELVSEENYFFRLSAYQQKLLDLYKNNPQFLYPDFRFNEVKSFVESGLKDISISRKSVKWGIPWPDDPEHVFSVWYDALTSYMSGIGFVDGEHDGPDFEKYWPADIHAMGKEIIRFHAVYWPAFLMAAEIELPKQIVAHGWLLFEQEKMSKSKGNVAYPEPIVKVLGNDALRYYLLREVVFGQDGNFSREALITRYNADLANGLGNLASRTLTMIEQYFEGRIPDKPGSWPNDRDGQIERLKQDTISDATASYDRFDFSHALEAIWRLVGEIDRYLVEFQPWALAKDANKRERLETVLFVAYDAVRVATFLAHPVLPETTQRIWTQLGQDGGLGARSFNDLPWGQLPKPLRIGKSEAVFPRAEKTEVLERIEAMENEIRNPGSTPVEPAATPGASASTSAADAE